MYQFQKNGFFADELVNTLSFSDELPLSFNDELPLKGMIEFSWITTRKTYLLMVLLSLYKILIWSVG